MPERPNTIQVEIFGQVYSVKAGKEPGYIEHIAAYVDAQMREISRAASAVDSMKIAVMAGLNIADELFRAKLTAHQATEKLEQVEAARDSQSEEAQALAVERLQAAHAAADERVRVAETAAEERVRKAEERARSAEVQAAERVRAVETMSAQRVREAEGKAAERAGELARSLSMALGDEA